MMVFIRPLLIAVSIYGFAAPQFAAAESNTSELVIRTVGGEAPAPITSERAPATAADRNPTGSLKPAVPVDASAYSNYRLRTALRQVQAPQQSSGAAQVESLQLDLAANPCAAMDEKPLGELGIGIALPEGDLPSDPATACWDQLNQSAGPLASIRHWPLAIYNWNATCLCHRPLYFEQINLERHGYGCCESLQPLASAAHFFGTIPALPYCMAVECPCECVYTLGHYRPGSCPPWRHHWPPFSPLAAAAEGGVWTGMIFLIP